MAGDLVGEAWVAIHARDGGMSREIDDITKKAGERTGRRLEEHLDAETRKRFEGDRSLIARVLSQDDPANVDRAFKRWGSRSNIKKAMEDAILDGTEDWDVFEAMVNDLDKALTRIDTRHLERSNRDIRSMRVELEKLNHERMRKIDDATLKAFQDEDWKSWMRNVREGEDANEQLAQSIIRLSNRYRDLRRDQILPLTESLKEYQRVQRDGAGAKAQEKLIRDWNEALRLDKAYEESRRRNLKTMTRDWTEALAMDEVFEANRRWGEFGATVRKARDELDRKRIGSLGDALAHNDMTRYTRNFNDMGEAVRQFNQDLTHLEQSNKIIGEDSRRLNRMMDDYRKSLDDAGRETLDFHSIIQRSSRASRDAIDRDLARALSTDDWTHLNKEMGDSYRIGGRVRDRIIELSRAGRINAEDVGRMNDSYRDWRREGRKTFVVLDAFPDVMGRAFGRGSRNNFLNFFGSLLRNFMRLGTETIKLGARIGNAVHEIIENFRFLRETGMGVIPALVRSFAPLAAAIVPTLAALAAGGAFLSKFLPFLASTVSMLTGVLTAWVGVLVNAVLGALVALAPVLVAVGGGFVALAVAAGRWYTEMKRRKDEGEALTSDMQAAERAVGVLTEALDRFTDRVMPQAIRGFVMLSDAAAGFMDAIGPGVEEGLERFFNILGGKSLEPALAAWRDSLPKIFSDFTAGLGAMTSGLIKFFVPVLPYAERLADSFYNMMMRFSAWTSSVEGQNTIAVWIDRAFTAAQALWEILGSLWGILGSIFSMGQDHAGGSWIEGLAASLDSFNERLKDEEGRKGFVQWFQDAKEFGDELWEILKDIGSFFRELDTEQARDDVMAFFGAIESLTDNLSDLAEIMDDTSRALSAFFGGEWVHEMEKTGDIGADLGAALGITPEGAKELGETWSEDFSRAMVRKMFGDEVMQFSDDVDKRVQSWMRDIFKVEGETYDEIATEIWDGLVDSIENPKFRDWSGENTAVKDFAKSIFKVEGSTWGEIAGNIWDGFTDSIKNPQFRGASLGGDGGGAKGLVKSLFKVEGETWREITTDMATGLMGAISDLGAEARKPNPTTQAIFRAVFNVEGETWSEITSNMWTGFKDSFLAGYTSWYGENQDTQDLVKRIFNVEGSTWSEILENMGDGFMSSLKSGITSWLAPREETKAFIKDTFSVEGETWGEIMSDLWEGFKSEFSSAVNSWLGENETTKAFFRDLFKVDGETWGEIAGELRDGLVESFWDELENSTLSEIVKTFLKDVFNVDGETWSEIGSNIVSGLGEGISEGFAAAGEWISEQVDKWIVQPVRDFLGIESPSTLFMEIGRNVVLGLIAGVGEAWGLLTETIAVKLEEWRVQFETWFTGLPGQVGAWLVGLGASLYLALSTAWQSASTWMSEKWAELQVWFTSIPGAVVTWLATLGTNMLHNFTVAKGMLQVWFDARRAEMMTWFTNLPMNIVGWLVGLGAGIMLNFVIAKNRLSIWLDERWADLKAWFTGLPGSITTWLGDLASSFLSPFSNAYTFVNSKLSETWTMVKGWVSLIKSAVAGVSTESGDVSRLQQAANLARAFIPGIPRFAAGGMVNSATVGLIGEAGREAVIPLDRPLSQIDPSVRDMAAALRGGRGAHFEAGSIILQYAGQDPMRAAESFLDGLVESL